jgi:transcription-repair coupling factor (superfamily II helicase)
LCDLLKTIEIYPNEVNDWHEFAESNNDFSITTYALDEGILVSQDHICLITEGELFGQQVMQRRRRSKASESPDYIFKSLAELKINAPDYS